MIFSWEQPNEVCGDCPIKKESLYGFSVQAFLRLSGKKDGPGRVR